MTTKKQKAANRRNARKSTGPKTPEGKARSAQNRMTHGLLSRQVLLKEEDPDRFLEVCGQLWSELRPVGELETYLAARITFGIWRMNRVARIEAQLFNDSPIRAAEPEIGIGQIFKSAVNNGGDPFSKLRRYETAIDLGIQRAYRLLHTAQAARLREEELGLDPAAAGGWDAGFPFEAIRAQAQAAGGSTDGEAGAGKPANGSGEAGAGKPANGSGEAAPATPPPAAPRMRGGERAAEGNGKKRVDANPSTARKSSQEESPLPLEGGGIGEGVAAGPRGATANGRKRKLPLEPIRPQRQPGNGAARE